MCRAPGPRYTPCKRIQKIGRRLHFHLEEVRRIPADLLQRLRIDVAEVQPVTGANHAEREECAMQGQTAGRRCCSRNRSRRDSVYLLLIGSGNRRVSQAVVNRESGRNLPGVAGKILLLKPAEVPVPVSDRGRVAAGDAETKVGDRVATEIITEIVVATFARRLEAVVLETVDFAAN